MKYDEDFCRTNIYAYGNPDEILCIEVTWDRTRGNAMSVSQTYTYRKALLHGAFLCQSSKIKVIKTIISMIVLS